MENTSVEAEIEAAWQRYCSYKEAVRPTLRTLRKAGDRTYPLAAFGAAVALAAGGATVVMIIGQELSGTTWHGMPLVIAVAVAVALLAALVPALIAAAAATVRVRSAVQLRVEARRAVRSLPDTEAFPLGDVLWAFRQATFPAMSSYGGPYASLRISVSIKVASRYRRHARPRGRLYDLDVLPAPAVDGILAGWDGNAGTFLAAAAALDDRAWQALMRAAAHTSPAHDSGWVNETLNTLAEISNSERGQFQLDAIHGLARQWDSGPAQLIRTAAQL
jgi:hypothetical protein